jgi:hypothetical protein
MEDLGATIKENHQYLDLVNAAGDFSSMQELPGICNWLN